MRLVRFTLIGAVFLVPVACGGRTALEGFDDATGDDISSSGGNGATGGSFSSGGSTMPTQTGGASVGVGGSMASGGRASGGGGGVAMGGQANDVCPDEHFDDDPDEDGLDCVPWSDCEPGTYQTSLPSATVDRGCASCPMGSFSDETNLSQCSPWRMCGLGFEVEAQGSPSTNTICKPRETYAPRPYEGVITSVGMTATTQAIYLGVNIAGESPEIFSMALDGSRSWSWSIKSTYGATLRDMEALGTDVYASGIAEAESGFWGDRVQFVGKYDSSGTEEWRVEFESEQDRALNALLATDGTNLIVARHILPTVCETQPDGSEECRGSGDSRIFLSSYDTAGTLLWEVLHTGYFTFAALSDLTVVQGEIYLSGELTNASGLHRFDSSGALLERYDQDELGGGEIGHHLAPHPNGGMFLVSFEGATVDENVVQIEDAVATARGPFPTVDGQSYQDMVAIDGELRLAGRDWRNDRMLYLRLKESGDLIERKAVPDSQAVFPSAMVVAPNGELFVGGVISHPDESFAFIVPFMN